MPGKSLFPAIPLSEARQIAQVIAEKGAGQAMWRADVFKILRKSPDSGPSRTLVTASSGYDLTSGSYKATQLALTELGRRLAVDADPAAEVDAVLKVDIFRQFFETYEEKPLPSDIAARSFLADKGIPADRVDACLEIMTANGRDVGLIAPVGGTERVFSRKHALEEKAGGHAAGAPPPTGSAAAAAKEATSGTQQEARIPSLNVNLEIHLPPDASKEVYEAIFSSIRKHLVDVE